ncbi:hypothetical protein HWV62_30027 [Athelia sp. TMB]|nr:hypothetical protein HWV62_30027 [Athelia sp. TMB]
MPVDLERQKKQQAAKIETHSSKKSKKAQRQSQKWQEKKATNAAKKAAAKAVNMSTTAQAAAAVDTAADTLESSGPSGPDEPGRSADGAQGKAPNHKCKCRKQHLTDDEDSDDKGAASRLHPDDPDNFVKLSTALCLLLSCEITEDVIDMADELIREYCTELIDLYGSDVLRPNHHYATHTAEFVCDYGPLHGFRTFLFERLNKVLKSYKTNNHSGGELETSFLREFFRTVAVSRTLATAGHKSSPASLQAMVHTMYTASNDDRGTVQSLVRELEEAHENTDVVYALSS